MNAKLRIFPAILLALIVAISSAQMALARGAPMPVGEMVLCTGEGAVTVAVDAQGNPTGEMHYCPDCAAVAFAALETGPTILARPMGPAKSQVVPTLQDGRVAVALICPLSRGPPLFV